MIDGLVVEFVSGEKKKFLALLGRLVLACVRACVRACVCVCVRACVRACVREKHLQCFISTDVNAVSVCESEQTG